LIFRDAAASLAWFRRWDRVSISRYSAYRCAVAAGAVRADPAGREGSPIARGPQNLLRYSHLGVQFVIILIAFALGGAWLDKRLSAGGLVTLAGIFAGAAIGFYVMYREIPRK
jgi:hypothetical protein